MPRLNFGMPMPPREKRTAQLKSHVPQSLREQYELFVSKHPSLSLSDYLYVVLEEHAAVQIAKQKIGARVGRD